MKNLRTPTTSAFTLAILIFIAYLLGKSIEVLNTGKLASPNAESTGVSLRNVRARLQSLFGAQVSLALKQQGENVSARIIVPISSEQIP